jgi:hypothetical protein
MFESHTFLLRAFGGGARRKNKGVLLGLERLRGKKCFRDEFICFFKLIELQEGPRKRAFRLRKFLKEKGDLKQHILIIRKGET